ncbi:hypothetical protein P8605_43540, partial [Streptomyces sp. T-3]|nr:hypothetical protein [Streptomyces sp. T-3]
LGADEIALRWAAWRAQIDDAEFTGSEPESAAEAEAGADATEAETAGTGSDAGAGPDSAPDAAANSGALSGDSSDDTAETSDGTESPEPAENSAADSPSLARRVLDEARAYLDTPPPLGRIRSAFASEDARILRADGPGWSLVARTDDIAFVLLDEEPGEVIPVGRGAELPGLLEALERLAVRPS